MPQRFLDRFCWNDAFDREYDALPAQEQYQRLVRWALKARGANPLAFDELTGWLLDDGAWPPERLAENERILKDGVLRRFSEQNARLRRSLTALEPSGVVNGAVFQALQAFDDALAGSVSDPALSAAAARVLGDFSAMNDRAVRALFAGSKTGETGTDSVELFGYINCLKECDAGVQWALFMPEVVKSQQNGFQVERFEYKRMPALRFVGKPCEDFADTETPRAVFQALDAMDAYRSGFDYDLLLTHFFGRGVDTEPWHGYWGRFLRADAPVPEGFTGVDFLPENDGGQGAPFLSQFAFALFAGDMEAIHRHEGYDSDAMYDVTRNIMLGQGVSIPYPEKYWTAEVFPDGYDHPSRGELFSAELS